MIIAGRYSFNGGAEIINSVYASELSEIESIISEVEANVHETKLSSEKAMRGRLLYSPRSLNRAFAVAFSNRDWYKQKIYCDYPTDYYTTQNDASKHQNRGRQRPFREMDFIRNRVGVEVQLGKYAFMVYNVCAKMTIFHDLGHIDVGVEIVPIKQFADHMSTGVSYFEQFVWDLEHRGVSDIDIPVLILGISAPELLMQN